MTTTTSNGMPFSMKTMQHRFKYTALKDVIQQLELEGDDCAYVIGDADNASYEFVIIRGGNVAEHSDGAYGNPNIALRDALITYYGTGG